MKNLISKLTTRPLFTAALAAALIGSFAVPARADGIILRGGANFASANTDPDIDEDNQDFRPGLNAGLLAEIGSGALRLLAGGGFEQKGIRVKGGGNSGDVRLDYVTVPVMISLGNVPDGGRMPRLFVNAGVEPAFLVSSDIKLGDYTFDIDAETFDFGLRGEAGLEIPLTPSAALILGGAYAQSLTDAAKGDNADWYNRTIHIFGGVKIGML